VISHVGPLDRAGLGKQALRDSVTDYGWHPTVGEPPRQSAALPYADVT
jgi:hypothetical protein